jgi:phosphinothricin acetyltransferase
MHHIRQATINDAEVIDHIWRQRLDEDQPPNEESLKHFRKMLEEQDDVFKYWVAEDSDGKIVAWVSATPMRSNPAIRNTMAETSVYLSREVRGRGLSSRLRDHVLNQLANTSIEWILWFVGASNHASKGIVKKLPWTKLGELPPVDKKPDRDVIEVWALPVGKTVEKEPES